MAAVFDYLVGIQIELAKRKTITNKYNQFSKQRTNRNRREQLHWIVQLMVLILSKQIQLQLLQKDFVNDSTMGCSMYKIWCCTFLTLNSAGELFYVKMVIGGNPLIPDTALVPTCTATQHMFQ